MLELACNNRQKVTVTASPDGPLDGALRVSVTAGDGTVEQDPATPNTFKAVSGTIAGETRYLVQGDTRAGVDENLIEEEVVLTVSAAEATGFGLVAGAVEPK